MKSASLLFLLLSALAVSSAAAINEVEGPDTYTITIHAVRIMNTAGVWMTVIEPDKVVDLYQALPSISFFNNGRVPPGAYSNFDISYTDSKKSEGRIKLTANQDFEPLWVKQSSFINVNFKLGLERPGNVHQIEINVDESSRTIPSAMIAVSSG